MRSSPRLTWQGLIVALAGAMAAPGAMATPDLLQRTPRQECSGGVPGCRTVRGDLEGIRRDSEREIALTCPREAPIFWNWAAEPSRHVQVYFVATIRDAEHRAVGARFTLSQQSDDERGYARVFLGCSAQLPSRQHPQTLFYTSAGWNKP